MTLFVIYSVLLFATISIPSATAFPRVAIKRQACQPPMVLLPSGCASCPDQSQPVDACTCACTQSQYTWDNISNKCKCNGYFDDSGTCVPCDPRLTADRDLNVCICPGGIYGWIRGTSECELCSDTQIVVNGFCFDCMANGQRESVFTNRCVCKTGFALSQDGTSCLPNCRADQVSTPNGCVNCGQFMTGTSGTCQCPSWLAMNTAGDACICPGPNQTLQLSGFCTCNDGFTNVNNSCVPICAANQIRTSAGNCQDCPANSSPVDNVCACNTGFTQVAGGQCTPATGSNGCPANSAKKNGVCTCKSGFIMQNGLCVTTCGLNAHWGSAKSTCLCDTGFYNMDASGNCSPIPDCGGNGKFNLTKNICVCNKGFLLDTATAKCVAEPDCGLHGIYSVPKQTCICNDDSWKPTAGAMCELIPSCPLNATFNKNQGICKCNTGYKMVGTQCTPK